MHVFRYGILAAAALGVTVLMLVGCDAEEPAQVQEAEQQMAATQAAAPTEAVVEVTVKPEHFHRKLSGQRTKDGYTTVDEYRIPIAGVKPGDELFLVVRKRKE